MTSLLLSSTHSCTHTHTDTRVRARILPVFGHDTRALSRSGHVWSRVRVHKRSIQPYKNTHDNSGGGGGSPSASINPANWRSATTPRGCSRSARVRPASGHVSAIVCVCARIFSAEMILTTGIRCAHAREHNSNRLPLQFGDSMNDDTVPRPPPPSPFVRAGMTCLRESERACVCMNNDLRCIMQL